MQEDFAKWRNEKVEQDVQFIQKIVHCLRSAQTDYNLPKSRPTVSNETDKNEKREAEGTESILI